MNWIRHNNFVELEAAAWKCEHLGLAKYIDKELKSKIKNTELFTSPLFNYNWDLWQFFTGVVDEQDIYGAELNIQWKLKFERLQKLDAFITVTKAYNGKFNYSESFERFKIDCTMGRPEITRELHNINKNKEEYKKLIGKYNREEEKIFARKKIISDLLNKINPSNKNIDKKMIGNQQPDFTFLYIDYLEELQNKQKFESIDIMIDSRKQEVKKTLELATNKPKKVPTLQKTYSKEKVERAYEIIELSIMREMDFKYMTPIQPNLLISDKVVENYIRKINAHLRKTVKAMNSDKRFIEKYKVPFYELKITKFYFEYTMRENDVIFTLYSQRNKEESKNISKFTVLKGFLNVDMGHLEVT